VSMSKTPIPIMLASAVQFSELSWSIIIRKSWTTSCECL